MYSQNLTRGTKLTELNTKKNLQIGFFPKWMYFVMRAVKLFCYGHYIMSITKIALFFVSFEIKNQFFLSAWSLF